MGMLNRQTREQRKMLRDNRDAIRELDQARREDREERVAPQGRAGSAQGSASRTNTSIFVNGRAVRPGEPVFSGGGGRDQGFEASREVSPETSRSMAGDVVDVRRPVASREDMVTPAFDAGDADGTQVHSPEPTRVMGGEGMSELDRRLAKLPTFKSSGPDVGPSV